MHGRTGGEEEKSVAVNLQEDMETRPAFSRKPGGINLRTFFFFLLLLTHDFDGQIGAPAPGREGVMEKKNYGGREKSIGLHFSEAPASSFLSYVRRRSYISFPALVLRVLKKSHRFFDRMRTR